VRRIEQQLAFDDYDGGRVAGRDDEHPAKRDDRDDPVIDNDYGPRGQAQAAAQARQAGEQRLHVAATGCQAHDLRGTDSDPVPQDRATRERPDSQGQRVVGR
jgi:hypothetical protein